MINYLLPFSSQLICFPFVKGILSRQRLVSQIYKIGAFVCARASGISQEEECEVIIKMQNICNSIG